MLYQIFNSAQNYQIDSSLLNEIPLKPTMEWLSFSKKEFKSAINKCNNPSAPGLDYVS